MKVFYTKYFYVIYMPNNEIYNSGYLYLYSMWFKCPSHQVDHHDT